MKEIFVLFIETKFGRKKVDEYKSIRKALKEYRWYRERNPDFSFVIVSFDRDYYYRITNEATIP